MSRIITFLFLALIVTIAIFSCQKELSFEGINNTPAIFTLDCSAPVIGGNYIKSTALTVANTVKLKATVAQPGTYTFVTIANGIRFVARGSFTTVGTGQVITFIGSGTPTAAINSVFAVQTNCSFTIPVSAGPPQGIYNLNCNSVSVNGIYTLNIGLDPAVNTITFTATVTAPGAYNIIQTFNGITFTAAGTFATTGSAVPITFTCSGAPTVLGQNNLTIGSNNCPVTIEVLALDANFLLATLGGVSKLFNTNLTGTIRNVSGGPSSFSIKGFRNTTGPEKFSIDFFDAGGLIVVRPYENIFPRFGNPSAVATYIDASGAPWESINGTFTITAITTTSATGNFSGMLTKLNTGGAPQTLAFTLGSFRVAF